MARYLVSGTITVGFSYEVEADDEDAAYEVEVDLEQVVAGADGRGLILRGGGARNGQWYADGVVPEPAAVVVLDD